MAPNIKQEISIKAKNWKLYTKKHHWLIEDPEDANYAYCKFCKKRLLHGIHQMKRLIHERGEHHKSAVKKFYGNMRRGNVKGNSDNENNQEGEEEQEQEEEEEEEDQPDVENNQDAETDANNEDDEEQENDDDDNEDNGDNEDGNDDDDNDDEEDQSEKKRTRHPCGSDEWYAAFPWCQRVKDDPKYMFCTYCKTKLKLTFRRRAHELSTRHQDAAKTANNLQNLSNLERSRQDKRIKYYPWLVYTKNPQYVFCKYCRVRLQSGLSRAKHETTKRHKESAAAYNSKKEPPNANTSANTSKQQNTATTTLTRSKRLVTTQPPRSIKSKVTMWRHKFPWLTFRRNEMHPNYGYCKFCEMRLYLLTEKYALNHQKSMKHIRIRRKLKRQELQSQVKEADNNEQTTTATVKPSEQDFSQLNKDYPWLLPDKDNDPNYGFCKYCNVRINVTGGLKNRHQQTKKHTKAKLEIVKENTQTAEKRKSKDSDTASDAIVVLDDDDMNDSSVKLEPMSEDDVLEYLLQRSEQAKTSKDCPNTDTNETMEPPHKRQQTSSQHDNLIDRAKRLTTAHLEILRLSRDFNDRKPPKKSGRISLPTSIFNTSAAIAALLSPPQAPPTPATPTRNNFELFFDSVCESVKTLPSDLAAEGKIKIAQLVADLEMRALQRSQSKDYQNTNSIQITATPMSSSNSIDNASPTLSNTDVPSTTTNGLDKDYTSPPTHAETSQQSQQSLPTYSLDSNLRIIPISSTPNYRHSEATTDTNVRRMQLGGTPQATTTQIKRIQINPAYQQSTVKQKSDGSASRVHTYSNSTPTTVHTAPQRTQNMSSISSPSTQPVYQHAHQIVSSSPDSVGSPRGLAQSSHTHNNASLIDNGIRRIHMGSRPQPIPQQPTQDLGFRRIHLPFKGTTITKTNTNTNNNTNTNTNPNKPSSSSFYINHSQNA